MNDTVTRLLHARADYQRTACPSYDETLHAVAAAVSADGSIGKVQIGALLLWKRIRANSGWVTKLHCLPDSEVRAITAPAIATARDTRLSLPDAAHEARMALRRLPGCGGRNALASALLLAAAPERMAVYDERAHAGLGTDGQGLRNRPECFRDYIAVVEKLMIEVNAAGHNWIPRDVDLALYHLGRRATATTNQPQADEETT